MGKSVPRPEETKTTIDEMNPNLITEKTESRERNFIRPHADSKVTLAPLSSNQVNIVALSFERYPFEKVKYSKNNLTAINTLHNNLSSSSLASGNQDKELSNEGQQP